MARRSRTGLIVGALVLLIAAGAGGASAISYRKYHNPIVVLATGMAAPVPRFVASGRYIALNPDLRPGNVEVWSIQTGARHRVLELRSDQYFMFSGRGSLVALLTVGRTGQSWVQLMDAVRGSTTGGFDPHAVVHGLAVSPEEDRIAVFGPDGRVTVKALKDGAIGRTIDPPANPWVQAFRCRFSPSGMSFAVSQGAEPVVCLPDGRTVKIGVPGAIVERFPSEDEVLVLVPEPRGDKTSYRVDAFAAKDGHLLRTVASDVGAFKTGGAVFALSLPGDKAIEVRSLATGELVRHFDADALAGFDLSFEGDRLAIAHTDGRVEVWATGK